MNDEFRRWLLLMLMLSACVKPVIMDPQSMVQKGNILPSGSMPVTTAATINPLTVPVRWFDLQAKDVTASFLAKDGPNRLFMTQDGFRLFVDSTGKIVRTADSPLSSHVVGVMHEELSSDWHFVLQSGAILRVSEPLGNVLEQKEPPQAMYSVTLGKHSVVAITLESQPRVLRTSDRGLNWKPITLPSGCTPSQVALGSDGQGALLCAPNTLYVTSDDAATFRLDASPASKDFGRIDWDANRNVLFVGEVRRYLLEGGQLKETEADVRSLVTIARESAGEPLQLMTAAMRQRAVLTNERYFELVAKQKSWDLVSGEPWGIKKTVPVSPLKECVRPLVAAHNTQVIVGCIRTTQQRYFPRRGQASVRQVNEMRLYRPSDGGEFVDAGLSVVRPDARLWLGPNGTLFLRGGCKSLTANRCARTPMLIRTPQAKSWAKAGRIREGLVVLGMAFSLDEKTTFALLYSDSNQRLAVGISRNGGQDFNVQWLPSFIEQDVALLPSVNSEISVGADGSLVVISFSTTHELLIHESLDLGASWRVRKVSSRDRLATSFGREIIALDAQMHLHQSHDSGVTWFRTSAPSFDETGGVNDVTCSALGCVFGTRLVRKGWASTDEKPISPPKEQPPSQKMLSCTPTENYQSIGRGNLPSLMTRHWGGRFAWVIDDFGPGSGAVLRMGTDFLSQRTVRLLEHTIDPSATAFSLSEHGAMAMRFRLEKELKSESSGKPKRWFGLPPRVRTDVQVAWYRPDVDKSYSATIKAKVDFFRGRDFHAHGGEKAQALATPAYWQVRSDGLILMPSRSSPIFLIQPNGTVSEISDARTSAKWANHSPEQRLVLRNSRSWSLLDRNESHLELIDSQSRSLQRASLWPSQGEMAQDFSLWIVPSLGSDALLLHSQEPHRDSHFLLKEIPHTDRPLRLPGVAEMLANKQSCGSGKEKVHWLGSHRLPYAESLFVDTGNYEFGQKDKRSMLNFLVGTHVVVGGSHQGTPTSTKLCLGEHSFTSDMLYQTNYLYRVFLPSYGAAKGMLFREKRLPGHASVIDGRAVQCSWVNEAPPAGAASFDASLPQHTL